MKVLVTGARGFIGRHLCADLERQGVTVLVAEGDVRTLETLGGAACVFHLAARRPPRDAEMWSVNVLGTIRILELVERERCPRAVVAGTCEEYGDAELPWRESGPLLPRRAYAASKAASSLAALAAHKERQLPVIVARPSVVYGPGAPESMFLGGLHAAAKARRPFRIGSPEPTRDFIHVQDVVEGLWRLSTCETAVGQAVNLASGIERQLGAVAREWTARAGIALEVGAYPARAGDLMRYVASGDRAAQLLSGWRPSRPFDPLS